MIETYSFSRLNLFHNCPYSYYLRYIEKRKQTDFSGITEFGLFMHEILEDYANKKLDIFELQEYYIDRFSDKVTHPVKLAFSKNYERNMFDAYYDSGSEYLETFEGFDFEIIDVEHEFYEKINDEIQIHGKIDLIGKTDLGLIIVDHKSKKEFKSKKEKKEYGRQLYIYALAAFRKYGTFPKRMYFNMFRSQIWEEIVFDEDEYKEALEWIKDSVRQIKECECFEGKPDSFFCNNFCGFKSTCEEIN